MVLMRIVLPVGQNEIRLDPPVFNCLKPLLDRFALFGEKSVAETTSTSISRACGIREKVRRGLLGLAVPGRRRH